MSVDAAVEQVAEHFSSMPRVDVVAAALTAFPPEREESWVHLGGRAWLREWVRPGSPCAIVPGPDAGPEAALSMPWISDRARHGVVVLTDADLLPPDAMQDRRELATCGARSVVVSTQIADGVMFGSLSVGSTTPGPWAPEAVADLRLLSSALASRLSREQAGRALADAIGVSEQAHARQQHFFATIGHELRTPLAGILGYTEFLVEEASQRPGDALADRVRQDAEVIMRAAEQLQAVIEDLLDTGRLLSSETTRERVAVVEAVEDVFHWHRAPARAGRITLRSTVDPALAVTARPAAFRQVLTNLVGNAITYNRSRGDVEVGAQPLLGENGEPRVRVFVKDTGTGLTPAQLDHAFEPFVRFAEDKPGTGLGLSLARAIVERDGGTLGGNSEVGAGSTFWIDLPAG